MEQFIDECEAKINNYERDPLCYLNAERSYLSLINNSGAQMPDRCFEFMAKYQHAAYSEFLIEMLQANIHPTHKYVCNMRLIKNAQIDPAINDSLNKGNQILESYSKFPEYPQAFTSLPNNSITVILQLSRSKTEIYFGCHLNTPENKQFIVKKKDISKS
jgi:hypothetical protein